MPEDTKTTQETVPAQKCPKCDGTMKRSNFRTGETGNLGGEVKVCDKCGHRTGVTK